MKGLVVMKLERFFFAFAAALLTLPSASADPVLAQQAYIKASNTGAGDQFGFALAISGDTMVVGAPYESSSATGVNGNQNDNSAINSGAAYVFVRSGTNWMQQAYLKASNTGADDQFGYSVDISGDTILVGAWREDSNATGVNGDDSNNSLSASGAAYVFVRTGTNWVQQAYLKSSNPGMADLFGRSVAVSGDTIVVGAYFEDSSATGVNGDQSSNGVGNSGAAYVFVRSGTTWTQQAYLKASNSGPSDQFGWRVAVSGDTVVVAANFEDSTATGVNGNQSNDGDPSAGAAYVFVRDGTNWSQQAYLKASNAEAGDLFGSSVAISGDTVAVGAIAEGSNAVGVNRNQTNNSAPNSGAVYLFVRSGTNWSQQAYLKASNTGSGDQFGCSVALSGNTLVVGATGEDSFATGVNGSETNDTSMDIGAAYVFVRNDTNWTQSAYLKASTVNQSDQFGFSVAVSGGSVVVGACLEDSNATGVNQDQIDNSSASSGAAYVFTPPEPPPLLQHLTPAQVAYVKTAAPGASNVFGYAVAISGDTMVVGGWGEASSATGVNGNQNDNSAPNSGAAYVFVRNGVNWVQQAYLKASNTGADDRFGYRVAISGDTIVVGAFLEDSSAAGVNGDDSDNNAPDSGAAYVFVRNGTNWTQQAYLKAWNTGGNDLFGRSVAISGDTIVVGANQESSSATGVNNFQDDNTVGNSGAAYVFVRSGTNWTQQAYLKASNTGGSDQFGFRVTISGDTIVVAAWQEASGATGVNGDQGDNSAYNSGAAYVFVRDGTNWTQQAYLKASTVGMNDFFGTSVAVSGDTVVVGAYHEDSNATGVNGNGFNDSVLDAGAAYVFVRNGTNWSQQAYLKASNTGYIDWFGFSVALSGDILAVSAPQESSNATGINGNQSDDSDNLAGAVYVFVRDGTNWSQDAYIKALNTDTGDLFGWSLGLSGDTLVVGTPNEDSNATGVNGNQSDNSLSNAGAVYVFTGLSFRPQIAGAPDGRGGYFVHFPGIAGQSYQLQRAESVSGPWTTNATMTALSSGPIEFHDTNAPPGQAFYRVAQQ